MNISFDWLKTILPIDLSAKKVAEILTDIGLEVEELQHLIALKEDLKA